MKINKIFFILLLINCSIANAQQQVIAPAGDYKDTTAGSLSWTLGEPVIVTLIAIDNVLTQGFQQGNIVVNDIIVSKELNCTITVFPNPSKDYVMLRVDKSNKENLQYILYNADGKSLIANKLTETEQQISLNDYASGTYLLSVLNEKGQILKKFKIIKK
jgi:hypothetical protein